MKLTYNYQYQCRKPINSDKRLLDCAWSYTSTNPNVFMVQCLSTGRIFILHSTT